MVQSHRVDHIQPAMELGLCTRYRVRPAHLGFPYPLLFQAATFPWACDRIGVRNLLSPTSPVSPYPPWLQEAEWSDDRLAPWRSPLHIVSGWLNSVPRSTRLL